MAETVAEARPRKQRPHALEGTVEAIGQNPPDPVRGFLLGCGALKRAVRLGQGRRTGLRGVAQMPEHAAPDDRREIHVLGETMAVFFISQEINRQRQPTPGQHRDHTLLPQRTDQTIEGHGRDMTYHRTPLQTEATVCRQQGIAGHLRVHLAIAQDKVWQHVNTALHLVHWTRQMVTPPRRTRT